MEEEAQAAAPTATNTNTNTTVASQKMLLRSPATDNANTNITLFPTGDERLLLQPATPPPSPPPLLHQHQPHQQADAVSRMKSELVHSRAFHALYGDGGDDDDDNAAPLGPLVLDGVDGVDGVADQLNDTLVVGAKKRAQHRSLNGCLLGSRENGLAKHERCCVGVDAASKSRDAATAAAAGERPPSLYENPGPDDEPIAYVDYESELQMPDIMRLIQRDLSEPYSIYTYRYFIHNWPKLCFLAMDGVKCVGAVVCKLDLHKNILRRGYIAMLAVDEKYRKRKIGSNLVLKAIRAMVADDADEVVLETEITNKPALRLYENLGFVRDKRLFRYYLNGVDALRLKLWLR